MPRDPRRLEPAETVELTGGPVEWAIIDGDGDRAPLLLLHEGLGCVALWRAFPHQLAEATGRRVLAFSRFGYGGSGPALLPRPPGFMHTEAMEVLPELAERLELHRPILVGHSDGASIALIAAAAHSLELTGVAALAPHILVEPCCVEAIEGIRERYLADAELRDRLGRHHRDPDMAFWGWNDVWLSAGFRSWNVESLLGRIRCPVLTVQGAADPYGTLVHVEAIERLVGGDHLGVVLDGVGHAPHLDAPGETMAAVGDFVADLA